MQPRHKKTALENLKLCKEQLAAALKWLERSYLQCKTIELTQSFSEEDFDKLRKSHQSFFTLNRLVD